MELKEYSVEYLKSGLSINTHVGCGLGCKYCILTTSLESFPSYPVVTNTPEEIYEKLQSKSTLFADGITPIYINNRTDPFLNNVKQSTYELLEILLKNQIKSPIIIISKLYPDTEFKKFCERLNLLYFYTYSGLKDLDYNSNEHINTKNLQKIEQTVPFENRFHYFRPIIQDYNDSYSEINNIFSRIKNVFRTTVAGGVRLNAINSNQFEVYGYDKNHKFLSDQTWETVNEIAKVHSLTLFRHTSCAISSYTNSPNRLRYFGINNHCIMKKCSNYYICKQKIEISKDKVDYYIKTRTSAYYTWNSSFSIEFHEAVEQELVSFLKYTFGIKVYSRNIILSPSEKYITK